MYREVQVSADWQKRPCNDSRAKILQDIDEAIKRLPPGEEDARNQRLKRASDCSLKKSYLPKEVQEQQTPFAFYLKVNISSP